MIIREAGSALTFMLMPVLRTRQLYYLQLMLVQSTRTGTNSTSEAALGVPIASEWTITILPCRARDLLTRRQTLLRGPYGATKIYARTVTGNSPGNTRENAQTVESRLGPKRYGCLLESPLRNS